MLASRARRGGGPGRPGGRCSTGGEPCSLPVSQSPELERLAVLCGDGPVGEAPAAVLGVAVCVAAPNTLRANGVSTAGSATAAGVLPVAVGACAAESRSSSVGPALARCCKLSLAFDCGVPVAGSAAGPNVKPVALACWLVLVLVLLSAAGLPPQV